MLGLLDSPSQLKSGRQHEKNKGTLFVNEAPSCEHIFPNQSGKKGIFNKVLMQERRESSILNTGNKLLFSLLSRTVLFV